MLELRLAGQPRPFVKASGPVWLALGFRPFFLLGAVYAVALVALWVASYLRLLTWSGPLPPLAWHAHEMIFGFTAAVVAGFLLTAVPNWTGLPTPRGAPLGGLVGLWLLGRLAVLSGPWGLAAGLDLAFLPALAAALAGPLLRARQPRNLIFLPLLAALTAADAMFWSGVPHALDLALTSVLLLVVLIGGRVIPFFIRAALPGAAPRPSAWLERLAVASLPALLAAEILGLPGRPLALLYVLAAAIHLRRLAGWHDRRLWKVPLLWILVAGYAWLAVGLALKGQACWTGANPRPALHALTAGCLGSLILGMMARVALGHTGRALAPARSVTASFALLTLAALLRVLGPLLAPSAYAGWIGCSGLLWCLAYGIYAAVYFPILTRPRADGQSG